MVKLNDQIERLRRKHEKLQAEADEKERKRAEGMDLW
jgi:hypothetical protein